MTIITIAGTSGSGKSHLMRAFLNWAKKRGDIEENFITGRAAPIGYVLGLKKQFKHNVFVVGHYDTPTGGCDTIHDVVQLFDLIKNIWEQGSHVLYEGLFVMNSTRGPALAEEVGRGLCVLQLTTPLATCLASINERRAERGAGVLEAKTNTIGNYKRAVNYCANMRDAGARVFKVNRDEALDKIVKLLQES